MKLKQRVGSSLCSSSVARFEIAFSTVEDEMPSFSFSFHTKLHFDGNDVDVDDLEYDDLEKIIAQQCWTITITKTLQI